MIVRPKYKYDTGPRDTIRTVPDAPGVLSFECVVTEPKSIRWRTALVRIPAEQIPAIYDVVRDLLRQEFRGLFPDVSDDERAAIQAAYDVLTDVGSRSRWQHDLTDRTHQALGVILGVTLAEQIKKEKKE